VDQLVVADKRVDRAPDLPPPADKDGDKVPDALDNCPSAPNPTQADLNKDGEGDACDDDIDGDTVPNSFDPFPSTADVVYYFKTANQLLTDGVLTGTWTAQGTSLCQNSYSDSYEARLKGSFLPASDYLVETRITVQSTDPGLPAGDWPGPGIDFRETTGTNDSGYDCAVDLWDFRVVIGEWDPSDWASIASSSKSSAPTSGPYRLRVVAKGSSLSCQVVGSAGALAQVTDSSNPSGLVGLFTYHTKACFEYLLVIKAP
jgi:hypothetical protein